MEQQEYYKQNLGKSKLNTDSVGLHIVFSKHSYEYKDGPTLLTKGEWRRKGRHILLKDNTLNSYFVLKLTGNNEFITEEFPFANYDLELMKVE